MDQRPLFQETECVRCKRMYLRDSGFCPHCGQVYEESWGEKLSRWFGIGKASAKTQATTSALFSTLIGLIIAAIAFIKAFQTESLGTLLFALVMLGLAVRAWFKDRNKGDRGNGGHAATGVTVREEDEPDVSVGSPLYHCEACGEPVAEDAVECPACGMMFGSNETKER